jgi:hypothetical protein
MTSQSFSKKHGVNQSKTPTKRYCADCKYGRIHETGSMIWVSCKLQDNGWKSISSICNLPDSEFLRLAKRRTGK